MKKQSKISYLRSLLTQLPTSQWQNVVAGNSTIKYKGFGVYQVWAGDMKPCMETTFDALEEYLKEQIKYAVEEI